jgi:phosphoketolase
VVWARVPSEDVPVPEVILIAVGTIELRGKSPAVVVVTTVAPVAAVQLVAVLELDTRFSSPEPLAPAADSVPALFRV